MVEVKLKCSKAVVGKLTLTLRKPVAIGCKTRNRIGIAQQLETVSFSRPCNKTSYGFHSSELTVDFFMFQVQIPTKALHLARLLLQFVVPSAPYKPGIA